MSVQKSALVRPVLLDLRTDEYTQRELLNVAAVAMSALSVQKDEDGNFLHAVAVLDEANKGVAKNTEMSSLAITLFAELRHRLMWLLFACQVPEAVDRRLLKLATLLVVHRLEAEDSVEVLRQAKAGLGELSVKETAALGQGEALVLAPEASAKEHRGKPLLVRVREACAQPGGASLGTVAADSGDEEE